MDLDICSFHSVKGGVGKSTLAVLAARGLATRETHPVVLIDMDLTGTSLADVLALRAPCWDAAPWPDRLARRPDGWDDTPDPTRHIVDRLDEHGALTAAAVPCLNDFLLTPRSLSRVAPKLHPAAFLWKLAGGFEHLYVIPSSALPADVERIVPVVFDEQRSSFLQARLELLIDALLGYFEEEGAKGLTLVFDTPPTIPGLSRSVLSLALRLGFEEKLALVDGARLPLRVEQAKVRWRAFLTATQDPQDWQALLRWLEDPALGTERDIAVLRVIFNRVTNIDQLKADLKLGGVIDTFTKSPWPGYLRDPSFIEMSDHLRIFQRDTNSEEAAWALVQETFGVVP